MLYRYVTLILPCFVFLSGCAPFAPSPRSMEQVLPVTLPKKYVSDIKNNTASGRGVPTRVLGKAWWKAFKSAELDSLVDTALAANFDILTAWATLRQSQAVARKTGAGLFPSLDGSGSGTHKRTSIKADTDTPRTESTSDALSLGLAAAYEVDLWGRVASADRAEILRVQASEDDVRSATMTVAASVADAWAGLLGNRAELEVVRRQIAINQDLVDLQTVRFANGLSSSLEVLQQKELLASVQAEVPQLEQAAAVWRNQLAVLQGTLPGTAVALHEKAELPVLPAMPEPGLPIQLLDARPDIRAAWARLAAADWDVSAAHANRYPMLKLTASGILNASSASLLFSNWVTTLAAALTAPVFDGGALAAEEARVRAAADIRVQAYAKAVAMALQEVDDALAAEQGENVLLRRLQEQMTFATAALHEARNSYLGGVNTFLNYIMQLKNVQSLERTIARQRVNVVRTRITLYRVLGGLVFPDAEARVQPVKVP